jgi:hypothetical protein
MDLVKLNAKPTHREALQVAGAGAMARHVRISFDCEGRCVPLHSVDHGTMTLSAGLCTTGSHAHTMHMFCMHGAAQGATYGMQDLRRLLRLVLVRFDGRPRVGKADTIGKRLPIARAERSRGHDSEKPRHDFFFCAHSVSSGQQLY